MGGRRLRLEEPRVVPLDLEEIDPEISERFGGAALDNIFRTLARHPKLMKRWLVFGTHVLLQSSLPPRDRELAILRVGWRCRSEYEWGQHVLIGEAAGLTGDEISRIASGPDAEGWSDRDRTILRAVDELHDDSFVTDPIWNALASFYETEQLLDFLFTVGQYNLVSMVLNTLGVQLDERLPNFPKS